MNGRTRKIIGGGVAVGLALLIGVTAFAANRQSPGHGRVAPAVSTTSSTTAVSSTTASTATKAPPTTVRKPAPAAVKQVSKRVDPMAGIAMVGLHGRQIVGLDANGREVRTLVTVFENRSVRDAQMLGDHHTIWYSTSPDSGLADNQCSDVVRLDLATNRRTVIAHAERFSVSADGSRVALLDVAPDLYGRAKCKVALSGRFGNIVLDVANGRSSALPDGFNDLVLSPDGRRVVATTCVDAADGCRVVMRTGSVPNKLGWPIGFVPVNDQALSFLDLTPRPDGLYALVDSQPVACGCTGRPTPVDGHSVTIRRLSWTNLAGSGHVVLTTESGRTIQHIIPTPNGMYAEGLMLTDFGYDQPLYRFSGSTPLVLRNVSNDWQAVEAIAPFAG